MDPNENTEAELLSSTAGAEVETPNRPERSRIPLILGGLAVAGVAILAIVFGGTGGDDGADGVTGASSELNELVFLDPDGAEGTLADFEGEPLVVNFFASWCAPCRAELPHFQEVFDQGDGRVQFVGISHDIDESAWLSLVEETELTFPTRFQPEQEIWESLNLFGMPATAFVSADGEVLYTFSGVLDQETLTELIAEHLNVEV